MKPTHNQVKASIQTWLEYGENSLNRLGGHRGVFSPGGWDYEVLKAHLEDLRGLESLYTEDEINAHYGRRQSGG